MKRAFLTLAMIVSVALTNAADYHYLVFKSADGNSTSLSALGLTITFQDGNLVASDGTTQASFPLSELSSMYFSNTSGIATVSTARNDGLVTVYSATGACCGQFSSLGEARQQLQPGVYVMRMKDQTIKIAVK